MTEPTEHPHNHRVQNQQTKSFAFIYISEKLSEKEIRKIIILCHSTTKKKIFRNKFNQRGERLIYWKQQNIAESD